MRLGTSRVRIGGVSGFAIVSALLIGIAGCPAGMPADVANGNESGTPGTSDTDGGAGGSPGADGAGDSSGGGGAPAGGDAGAPTGGGGSSGGVGGGSTGNTDQSKRFSCVGCHGPALAEAIPIVGADEVDRHYAPGERASDAICLTCHDQSTHQSGVVRVHPPTDAGNVVAITGDPRREPEQATKLDAICTACHASDTHAVHPGGGATASCATCHNIHQPRGQNLALIAERIRNQSLGQDRDVVFQARSGAGSFSDGQGANDGICQACHTQTRFHRYDGSGAAHNAGADCTTCHPHADGFLPSAESASCVACHSQTQGPRAIIVQADGTGGHTLGGAALTDADCVKCHDQSTHQSGVVRLWSNPKSPTTSFARSGAANQLDAFCGGCHDAADDPVTHDTGTASDPACVDCHAVHDPAGLNLSLIRSSIRNAALGSDRTVVFRARSGAHSFSDGDSVNDGVCQVCHTQTDFHRYDGGGFTHNEGDDCTACHAHASGFAADASVGCTGCHNQALGSRRAVMGEFGYASHHAGPNVTDADCVVCHEMSQHRQGSVVLRNADDPDNASGNVTLSGDPLGSASEAAKLAPFCLACHDQNAAGGSAPFSDGVTPAAIDAGLWANSTHQQPQMSCFGDGENSGCHSSGHGSVKRALLGPFQGGQTPVAGDALREEEGLCYGCHDADGPAASNVMAEFALATHHDVSSADQSNGARVECVNCHNPHTVSPARKLVNPDDGTPWGGAGEQFCLTCHDGAPPAGVAFPATSSGTGYDKSAFIGTPHYAHLGDACRACHSPHGGAYRALLSAEYVVASQNQYTFGDGDYAACWACHSEVAIMQSNNAFGSRHDKHVRDERTPCILCHDAHAPRDAGEAGLVDFTFGIDQGFGLQMIDGRDASSAFTINGAQTQGTCYLRCHGERHDPENYTRQPLDCTQCHDPHP